MTLAKTFASFKVMMVAIAPAITAAMRKRINWSRVIVLTKSKTATTAPFLGLPMVYKVTKEKVKLTVLIPPNKIIKGYAPISPTICIAMMAACAAPKPGINPVKEPEKTAAPIALSFSFVFI